jgi:hypothetical protein
MNKTVLYILSTNYAGSHYLSLLLGSNSQAIHLGEVKRLRFADEARRKRACYVCREKPECSLFAGIHPGNLDDIYATVFSRTPAAVLIDNSKNTFWARCYLDDGRYAKKYIHLIRDPRALVRRWMLTFTTPKQKLNQRLRVAKESPRRAVPALLGSPATVYLDKWLLRNQEITRFIAENDLDSIVTTYEDLATNTAGELTRLCDWIGLKFEPPQMDYWSFQHHGTQKKDYAGTKERLFDLRWKEFLKPAVAAKITRYRPVNDYLKSLSLRFTDNGLTRQ